ncbi:MAG: hypothetical protein SH819_01215 [Cytophagales bacterium]|nr:hypothetical protein [Cytophagales bacterium]
MKRIKRFGIYQTAKVTAVIYFLVSAIIMIPIGLFMSMMGPMMDRADVSPFPFGGGMVLIFLPFIYGVVGFVFTAIACAIYNLISGWTGGIELEFEAMDAPQ